MTLITCKSDFPGFAAVGMQEDQLWVQYVASIPATRADVVNLQKNLDKAYVLVSR